MKKDTDMALILASRSPRRQELLHRMGLHDFQILVPEAEERYDPTLPPEEIVMHISRVKSLAAAPLVKPADIVITADTMVFLGNERLGKPRDEADALRMLRELQGNRHRVCTGLTVSQGERRITQCESTDVFFRRAAEAELRGYIATGEPMDKAGAYGVQGLGSLFVERIEGDYYNVMGLPILRLSRLLRQFGVHFFDGEDTP